MSQRRRKKRKGCLKIHCDLSWGTFSNGDDGGGRLFLNVQAQVSEGHGAWRGNQWSLQAEKRLLLGAPLGPPHTCTIGRIVLSDTSQGSHHVLNTALPLCCSLAGNWTRPVTLHSTDINLFPLFTDPHFLSSPKYKKSWSAQGEREIHSVTEWSRQSQ